MKDIMMKWVIALVVLLVGLVVIDISVRLGGAHDNGPCLANVTGVRVISNWTLAFRHVGT